MDLFSVALANTAWPQWNSKHAKCAAIASWNLCSCSLPQYDSPTKLANVCLPKCVLTENSKDWNVRLTQREPLLWPGNTRFKLCVFYRQHLKAAVQTDRQILRCSQDPTVVKRHGQERIQGNREQRDPAGTLGRDWKAIDLGSGMHLAVTVPLQGNC